MNQAQALLGIQRADLEIVRLEKRLAEMPEKRAILQARKRIADIEALEQRTAAFIKEVEAKVAKDEDEVSGITAKMESEQAKLLSGQITNPKEVQHISNELDSLRRRKESLEEVILGQMERREAGLEQGAKVQAAMDEAREKEAQLVEGFKGKGGSLQEEIDRLSSARETALASLEAENRALYDKHRGARPGVILGVLTESTCGACRVELPAETVRELRAGSDIAECPLCRRILLVRLPEEPSDE